MALERRFLTSFKQEGNDQPGLLIDEADDTYVVLADGSRVQLPGGSGTGCEYLTCADDQALLQTKNVLIVAQPDVAEAVDVYVATQDDEGNSRGGFESNLDAGVSTVRAFAQTSDGMTSARTVYTAEEGVDSTAVLGADQVHFNGLTAITRPELDLASPTLAADVAQALADLGLVTLA